MRKDAKAHCYADSELFDYADESEPAQDSAPNGIRRGTEKQH
jgi:hypothetical protein